MPGTQYAAAPSIQELAFKEKPRPDTPRRNRKEAVHESKLTQIRTDIGEAMNPEILICAPEEFKVHYLPPLPVCYRAAVLKKIKKTKWEILDDRPSKSSKNEAGTFEPLRELIEAVGALEFRTKERNRYKFRLVPNTVITSDVKGANFRVDACVGEPDKSEEAEDAYESEESDKSDEPYQPKTVFHVTDIILPMEFKKSRTDPFIRLNRLQVVSAASHIMNDDVRRTFILAISIEDNRMSLWYFSRSHSIKSESFDFMDKNNLDFLLEVLISLMFATDEELGLDPRVKIRPPQEPSTGPKSTGPKSTGPKSTNTQQLPVPKKYIYEFQDGTNKSRFFCTTSCISDFRTLYISGRKTRVFGVIEVEKQGTTWQEKEGAEPMVLKDVWLDANAHTEKEIQHELFKDLQALSANSSQCLSGLESDILKPINKVFEAALQNQTYKDFFLVIKAESVGNPCKDVLGAARPPDPPVFLPKSVTEPEDVSQRSSRQSFHPANPPPIEPTSPNQANLPDFVYRKFAPKKRCFFLFTEECTTVDCLPTVGDAFKVLTQCIIALRLMFCARWVHRDISVGNILAIKDKNGDWKIKLADLEYAKKFDHRLSGASDPKTGTPGYMAHEILLRAYIREGQEYQNDEGMNLDQALVGPEAPFIDTPVRHNYQHDLESIFWIALWIITVRVNHRPSMEYARNIFPRRGGLTVERQNAFVQSINKPLSNTLLKELQPLADILEKLRKRLHGAACARGKSSSWSQQNSYSFIHAFTAGIFAMAIEPADWHHVELALPNSGNPPPAPDSAANVAGSTQRSMGPPALPVRHTGQSQGVEPPVCRSNKRSRAGKDEGQEGNRKRGRSNNGVGGSGPVSTTSARAHASTPRLGLRSQARSSINANDKGASRSWKQGRSNTGVGGFGQVGSARASASTSRSGLRSQARSSINANDRGSRSWKHGRSTNGEGASSPVTSISTRAHASTTRSGLRSQTQISTDITSNQSQSQSNSKRHRN